MFEDMTSERVATKHFEDDHVTTAKPSLGMSVVLKLTLHMAYHYHHHHAPHDTRLTALFPGTTRVSRYQKGETNLDFTEARDSEWQWHQQGHMQVCTSL